jgi:hypothetical protein
MSDTDLVFKTFESSKEVFDSLKAMSPNGWVTLLIEVPIRPDPDTVGETGYRRIELRGLQGVAQSLTTASQDMLYTTKGRFIGSPLDFDVTVTIQARQADLLRAKLSLAPEALGIHKEITERRQ